MDAWMMGNNEEMMGNDENKSHNIWRCEIFFVSLQQNKELQSYGKI